jgi:predicted glycosyltransferase
VMITMGGIAWEYTFYDRLQAATDYYFIVPNGGEKPECRGNLILLPTHSRFFHPDLMNAADAVIAKVGYSSLAEVYQSGMPLGYIPRPQFPESPVLVDYIRKNMPGLPITEDEFVAGDWLARLPDLLALPRANRANINGADEAAEFIVEATRSENSTLV